MDATSPKIAATGTIATRTIAPDISADELAAAAGDNKALAKMLSALISSNNALISSNNEFQNRIETLETELDIANNELSVASVANTGPIKHASLQNLELMGVESKTKHTGSSLASATFTRLYDFLGFLIAKSATYCGIVNST